MIRDRIIWIRISSSFLAHLTRNPTSWLAGATRSALWFAAIAVACSRPEVLQLRDTEGRKFTAQVKQDEVVQLSSSDVSSRSDSFVLQRKGYLVAICPESSQMSTTAIGDCRGLICTGDYDCPPAHGLKMGTCINGLCVEPSQTINSDDAIMLCLAGTGIGRSSTLQVDRFALGLNCGQPCRVPSPCRQP